MSDKTAAAIAKNRAFYLGKPSRPVTVRRPVSGAKETRKPTLLRIDDRARVDYMDEKRHRAALPGRIEMLEQNIVRISYGNTRIEIPRTNLKRWLRGRGSDGYSLLVHNDNEVNLRVEHVLLFMQSTANN